MSDQQIIEALRRRCINVRAGERPRPIRALAIARRFDIRPGSSRESRRRGVRKIIARLRDEGHAIATDGTGYWLAMTPEDHAVHQAFLRRSGLKHLASAAKDQKSLPAADASGQMRLFM